LKLLNCSAKNFGSYEFLGFDFSDQGLALIQGATGSGKSTLCDIPTWCLFGITAKNGAVDEVRSWTAPNSPTEVRLSLETPDGIISVTRIRGTTGQNDLYWEELENLGKLERGKDITETQKLLNARLGIDEDLYLSAAYFCEFSPTYGFFSAAAKGRRALFEKVADLSLPVRLSESTSRRQKELKKTIAEAQNKLSSDMATAQAEHQSYLSSDGYFGAWELSHQKELESLQACSNNFDLEKESTIEALQTKCDRFEQDRDKRLEALALKALSKEDAISELSTLTDALSAKEQELKEAADKCGACGAPRNHAKREEIQGQISRLRVKITRLEGEKDALDGIIRQIEAVQDEANPYPAQVKAAQLLKNHYFEKLSQLQTQENPHKAQKDKFHKRWSEAERIVAQTTHTLNTHTADALTVKQLSELSLELRGALLQKAVAEAESRTNASLNKYSDAELRVKFTLEGADNLDVGIYKSGYTCTYRQLSKGQRSLLRLAFAVSIMRMAADQSGVHFDQLFFDEPTDGCDVALKFRTFGMLEELAKQHGSVFVIEHSTELKSAFSKAFQVKLVSDVSTIEESYE
jgi:DNA repair exonuclease SbcCD ATPase subunit